MLPQMKENDNPVLIYTLFVMVLDNMEQYLRIHNIENHNKLGKNEDPAVILFHLG